MILAALTGALGMGTQLAVEWVAARVLALVTPATIAFLACIQQPIAAKQQLVRGVQRPCKNTLQVDGRPFQLGMETGRGTGGEVQRKVAIGRRTGNWNNSVPNGQWLTLQHWLP